MKYKIIRWTAQCISCGNHGEYCDIEVDFMGHFIEAEMCPTCIKKYDPEAEMI